VTRRRLSGRVLIEQVTRDSAAQVIYGNTMLDLRASIMSSQIAQSESDAERRELPISEVGSAVAEEAIKKEPLEGRE
jgi:hypothetical protein